MFNRLKHLRFSNCEFLLSIRGRAHSNIAPNTVVEESKEFPDGVSVEVLNPYKHDIGRVRKLLVDAFVLNREPIIYTLCERAYSDLPINRNLPEIEQKFEDFFSDQFVSDKIRQSLSIVAIEKKTERYISSAFVEQYNGKAYSTEQRLLQDPFWMYGLRLMDDLHKKACPLLTQYDSKKIAFMSHAATHPEYTSSGLMETIKDRIVFPELVRRGFDMIYGVVTTKRNATFIEKRFGYVPIAEIRYADYEVDGEHVFSQLAEKCVSAKAMVKFL